MRRLHVDPALFVTVILLACAGLATLYSASGESLAVVYRQGMRIVVALITMLIVAQISPAALARSASWLYLLSIVLLLAVLIFGDETKGARRWLDLGLFRFQPSELVKLSVPIALARYYAHKTLPPNFSQLFLSCCLLVPPVLLIAWEPDLGTALLVAVGGMVVIFATGVSWRYLFFLSGVVLAYAPLHWYLVMHDYQRSRVLSFLNPSSDPLGAGYHTIQSQIAIGSGGFYGKGWLNGTQSHLEFLPERSTDFVFAVFCEEFGLLGVMLLLSLYLFIIFRGFHIARNAGSAFGKLLATALATIFFAYVFVNMGMTSGLLPVVGVPLPLISLGGTAMVTIMAGMGVLMALRAPPRRLP